MADGKPLSPLPLHLVHHPAEQVELGAGVGGAVRIRLVRHGKVGKDALRPQTRQTAGGADVRRAGAEVSAGHQIAQPGHTGIHLDVDGQLPAAAHRLLAVLQRLGLTGHRLGDVQVDEVLHLLPGRMPQNKDGHGDAPRPQLHGLVQTGHRQIVRAQRL